MLHLLQNIANLRDNSDNESKVNNSTQKAMVIKLALFSKEEVTKAKYQSDFKALMAHKNS